MYTSIVQYSGDPAPVTRLVHSDGVAEYRMTKNVRHREDEDGNVIIEGEEVYFEIAMGLGQPTAADVEADFDNYWANGISWKRPAHHTVEERLTAVEADNLTALEGIAELYEMMMQ